jgi:hypothetical protein
MGRPAGDALTPRHSFYGEIVQASRGNEGDHNKCANAMSRHQSVPAGSLVMLMSDRQSTV